MTENEVQALIKKVRKEVMPGSEAIVKETFQDLGLIADTPLVPGITPDDALSNFNTYLKDVFNHTLVVLEKYENVVYPHVLRELPNMKSSELSETISDADPLQKQIGDALVILYPDIWRVMLSRSQSRKTRGGKDWEHQIAGMLRLGGIPFQMQEAKYRTDFMIPSATKFERDRTKAILLSAKRTLRERWRQVAEELFRTKAANAYLAVAENKDKITQNKVKEIWDHNVHLLVWDEVKQTKFPDHPGVMDYTTFATSEIPALRRSWI